MSHEAPDTGDGGGGGGAAPEKPMLVDPDQTGTFPAMLRATGVAAPIVLLLLSALTSLTVAWAQQATQSASLLAVSGWIPLLAGLLVTVAAWLACSRVFYSFSAATRSSASSYLDARDKLRDISRQLGVPDDLTYPPAKLAAPDGMVAAKYADALNRRGDVVKALRTKGARWVMGAGYTDLWSTLYRASEAALLCIPLDEVIAQAVSDIQRLEGSDIPTRDALLDRLRRGIIQLGHGTVNKLDKVPAGAAALVPDETGGRLAIREVRYQLNQFIGKRYAGVIARRNLMSQIGVLTGLAAYALFLLALLGNLTVIAATGLVAFYITGTLIGFFNMLTTVLTADTVVEGYGRLHARMFAMPTLAGLAAIGGIFIAHAAGAPLVGHSAASSDISSFFALTPLNVVTAAIFGLTPTLILSVFQQQSDRYLSEIKSTQATQQST